MQCKLTAEQLGEMSEFLAFLDQYLIEGTITDNVNETRPYGPDAFVSVASARWRKVKPIFDSEKEKRLQAEIAVLQKAIDSKREQMRTKHKSRDL